MLANRLYFQNFPNSLNCKIGIFECWLIGSTPKLSSFHEDIGKWRFLNISLDCTFQFFLPTLILASTAAKLWNCIWISPWKLLSEKLIFWHLRKLNFKICSTMMEVFKWIFSHSEQQISIFSSTMFSGFFTNSKVD